MQTVCFASFMAVVLIASLQARAQDYWSLSPSQSGDWSVAANWNAGVPNSSVYAYIVNGGTATITQLAETCGTLSLGSSAGSGTVRMTGGSLAAGYDEFVGNSGTGNFIQAGGTCTLSYMGYLYLGNNAGSSGMYELSGGSLSPFYEVVGNSGVGTFNQSGGNNVGGETMYLGNNSGGAGTYNLVGNGLLSGYNEVVGNSGTGTFTQSAGTNNIVGLNLGSNVGSIGTYNLGSGQLVATSYEWVGSSGTGIFTQTGGAHTINNTLSLGLYAGSNGRYDFSGGQLSAGNEYVGNSGNGIFIQTDGINTVTGGLVLGLASSTSGSYSLSGSARLSASDCDVGEYGVGTFTQTGGINTISGSLSLGFVAGGNGEYNFNGGQLSTGYECVGFGGTGTFTQISGINTISGSLSLGARAGSTGTYILSGSSQLSAASVSIGCVPGATAVFEQSAGTNTTSLLSIGNGGSYLLAGGALQVASCFVNQGTFSGSGTPATLGANCLLDLTSGTWQNLGAISLSMGANSLLIVPLGFNPSASFANYSSSGLTHTLGTTLTILAGQGFGGSGSIIDPVTCQGTITAISGGVINLMSGLTLSGTGAVQLGDGSLTTNNLLSGISDSSQLTTFSQYVGSSGTGVFTQSGGTNNTRVLYLGFNAGDNGAYNLSGIGQLFAPGIYIGRSGTGTFTQTGGTNSLILPNESQLSHFPQIWRSFSPNSAGAASHRP
jgi:hypothetical protein